MALHVRGVLLPDDEVRDPWLVGDRVTFTPVPGAETVAEGGFVLPGLTDAHCHIGIARGGAPITSLDQARELPSRPGRRRAGHPRRRLALPVRRIRGRAGTAATGPRRPARRAAEALPARHRCRGRRGGGGRDGGSAGAAGNGWVKLVGDWIDRGVGDLAPAWDADTLTAAVRAAHDAGVRAAVHTFSESAVETMVPAGVDSVEHGTGLSLDLIDQMVRQGTALVPTMINIATFGHIADQAREKFPGYADHMLSLRDRFPEVVRAAHEAGVPIYVGTDAGGGIDHGLAAQEMLLLHERAGMAPLDTFGVAVMGALVATIGRSKIDELLPSLPDHTRAAIANGISSGGSFSGHHVSAQIVSASREAFVSALGTGLTVGAVVTLIGAFVAWTLIAPRPKQVEPEATSPEPRTEPERTEVAV